MTTTFASQNTDTDLNAGPKPYYWAADDFERACEMDAFGHDRRLELIQGRVFDRMPESPLHAYLTTLIFEILRSLFLPGMLVRGEKPLRIAFDGEPIPDISIIRGPLQNYWQRHPTPEEVALLVEVAVSSTEYDLGGKALLYAQAGITDYWVALPEAGQIVVHRGPTAQGYASVTRLDGTATVSPLAAPEVVLPVRELLGHSVGEAPFGVHPE